MRRIFVIILASILGVVGVAWANPSQAAPANDLRYEAHIQNIGWQAPERNEYEIAGTVGQSLRLEALYVYPTGDHIGGSNVQVCYRVYIEGGGWQPEGCSGKSGTPYLAGTVGRGLRVEAFQMRLVNANNRSRICYEAHVQSIGWQAQQCAQANQPLVSSPVAGTINRSLRIEAIRLVVADL